MSNTKMSSRSLRLFSQATLGILAGMSLAGFVVPQNAIAQTGEANPLEDLQTRDNTNPFSASGNGSSLSMFDILHRAQTGMTRPMDEFLNQQQNSLDDAAADFRTRQLQLLQNQQQMSPTETVENSETAQ